MEQITLTQFSAEQLKNIFKEAISSQIRGLSLEGPKPPEEYLTIEEVSLLFKVDISTVYNWRKKGILKASQLGGRVYFKRSDIDNAVVELKS
jgi:excisionase family DNA binding protein